MECALVIILFSGEDNTLEYSSENPLSGERSGERSPARSLAMSGPRLGTGEGLHEKLSSNTTLTGYCGTPTGIPPIKHKQLCHEFEKKKKKKKKKTNRGACLSQTVLIG